MEIEIAKKLKELRKEENKTLKEISIDLKMPLTTYANYEQGTREPNLQTLKELCIYFKVSADYFLGLEDEFGHTVEHTAKAIQVNNGGNNTQNNYF